MPSMRGIAVVAGLSFVALLFVCVNVSFDPLHTRTTHRHLAQKRFALGPEPLPRAASAPPTARATRSAASESAAATGAPRVSTAADADVCANASTYLEHTEFWGGLLVSGEQNAQRSAAECCRTCRDYEPTIELQEGRPCTTFVFHPTNGACWLKHTSRQHLAQPGRGPAVPWTSGVLLDGHRRCDDCVLPATYTGCVSKALCNTSRECGSPAIDGYARIDPKCLERSADARRYLELVRAGVRLDAHAEEGADFDGLGVRWGIGHKKSNWSACEAACIAHRPSGAGPFGSLPCNVWTWCGNGSCWEPDAHSHSFGDCWLKFSERPEAVEVNMRMPMSKAYMRRHRREMAGGVTWVSGVLLAPGTLMTNGTWGPRAFW
ncbi:hypothetical protein KFE25_009842 [Diacronema lutheri]|uniref:Apple domain-containing protein n=1 Tax=Diacronema lutheri TaxID=2081491 RepID=A0A8J5XAP8_DIALT|nr:hypothetical protein KFE25_009842 [Diacronema lutheri]